ncbi:MAG TPA: helix-turn-helix domain-containing protein [Solirubrobacterales bacterium]|nr:helix-turn-helix domain-containing protein [Solirubrobacterales bacterium]
MSEDDVLFGYRLRVFDHAARTSVSEACRVFGIHRSTYYVWKRRAERHGLEILRPRERRRPRMPQQLSPFLEQRIVAFALGHPGYGPQRIASELRQPRWGGILISHNGVWRCLKRHGLNTRAKRLALVAGYAAPYQPPREPEPERHIEVERPGELVGIDCFFVGRLQGTKGAVWQLTAIDVASSYAWAELVTCPHGNPTGAQTSKLARRVCADLSKAGWRLERMLSDNGGEFRSQDFRTTLDQLDVQHTFIHAGRPQTNGHVEALHRLILEECWRPAFARYLHVRFTGLKRDLAQYVDEYNFRRVHNGRLTRGRIPADIVYGANKMKAPR